MKRDGPWSSSEDVPSVGITRRSRPDFCIAPVEAPVRAMSIVIGE